MAKNEYRIVTNSGKHLAYLGRPCFFLRIMTSRNCLDAIFGLLSHVDMGDLHRHSPRRRPGS